MDSLQACALVLVGVLAGIANTVAGGGSLLAVPLLVLCGYPATVANATTRPAIFFQNVFALLGFRSRGILSRPHLLNRGLLLAACTLPGALAGAWFAAARISDQAFERLLAAVMVGILILTWVRRGGGTRRPEGRAVRTGAAALCFFGIGFYGGFIQAGVGFLIMAALMNTTRCDLAEINAQKVLVVLIYTSVAIAVFIAEGRMAWLPAAFLVVGQSLGGYLGSIISVKVDDTVLMRIYAALLLGFAVTLLI